MAKEDQKAAWGGITAGQEGEWVRCGSQFCVGAPAVSSTELCHWRGTLGRFMDLELGEGWVDQYRGI